MLRLVERGRLYLAIELHEFAQAELFGDVVKVAQVLRLSREPFFPVPLVQQFARERIAIGVALGIEAGARIAIPVPGSAEIRGCIQHEGVNPEVGQTLDLVNAGYARANHDDFVV